MITAFTNQVSGEPGPAHNPCSHSQRATWRRTTGSERPASSCKRARFLRKAIAKDVGEAIGVRHEERID
jgi:hypothetical protein